MSEYAIPKDDLLAALTQLTSAYQRQHDVLSEISRTSETMATAIEHPDSLATVDKLMETRQRQYERLQEVALPLERQIDRVIGEAGYLYDATTGTVHTSSVPGESTFSVEHVAKTISAAQSDSRALMESIMNCQAKCESVLRSRLDATAKAIGESVQKRRVNAAYGPAHTIRTPRYLDKQQ